MTGCPAGDPCPGTGCPACCPSYDPCGEPGCLSCGGSPPYNRLIERKNVSKKKDQAPEPLPKFHSSRPCNFNCQTDGVIYPECPVHRDDKPFDTLVEEAEQIDTLGGKLVAGPAEIVNLAAKTSVPCVCGRPQDLGIVHRTVGPCYAVSDDERQSGYPFKDTDGMVVLGPDTLLGPDEEVIVYKGRHYHGLREAEEPSKREITKAEAIAEEKDWRKRQQREQAMHMAVQIHAANSTITSDEVMKTAQTVLDWMRADD